MHFDGNINIAITPLSTGRASQPGRCIRMAFVAMQIPLGISVLPRIWPGPTLANGHSGKGVEPRHRRAATLPERGGAPQELISGEIDFGEEIGT